MHRVDRQSGPPARSPGSRAMDRLRPRPNFLPELPSHQRARNAHGASAAGYTAAMADRREWISPLNLARRSEKQTSPWPAVRSRAANVCCRSAQRHCHGSRRGRSQRRYGLYPSASGAESHREMPANRMADGVSQSTTAEMKSRGRYRPESGDLQKNDLPAIRRSRVSSSICVGWAAAAPPMVARCGPPCKRAALSGSTRGFRRRNSRCRCIDRIVERGALS